MDPFAARFGGIQRLFGQPGAERLRLAHVAIVGIGGVGSWAVEALARSGVGQLTLIDMDEVCISNTNRQLPALSGAYGQPKVEVMASRVRAINPDCTVHPVQKFLVQTNAGELLAGGFDAVIDAIDTPPQKCLLIARSRELGLPLVTSGGAGGRRDPTRIQVKDLAFSSHDALLEQVRRSLRQNYGFPRHPQAFGVDCVFSTEAPVFPAGDGTLCTERPVNADLRLDCNRGFGTAAFVTGAFGFAAAAAAVRRLTESG